VIALSATAFADDPKDLFKQGVDLYKAGKYEESARVLKKSYEQDQNPNTLFALAQSERLLGECKLAAQHYKKVIQQVNDLSVAKLVQQNLELCEKQEPVPEPAKGDDKKADAAPPQVVTKVVTRDVGHTDKLAIALATVGAVSLGVGGGLYLASSANKDAADKARTLDDHNAFSDKASSEQTASYVAFGAGAAMVGYAVYRWVTSSPGDTPTVAVAPSANGGSFVVTGRW
jgi:tetratricopeptide (TPR) repeat protein